VSRDLLRLRFSAQQSHDGEANLFINSLFIGRRSHGHRNGWNGSGKERFAVHGMDEGGKPALVRPRRVGKGHDVKCGRQFFAWLGLVPGQYSSGGKQRLGRIPKAGDAYLRTLLIMGAKAVLAAAKNRADPVTAVSAPSKKAFSPILNLQEDVRVRAYLRKLGFWITTNCAPQTVSQMPSKCGR
jgi:hypothetical protein